MQVIKESRSMTSLNGLDSAGGLGVYQLNSSNENSFTQSLENVNLDELEDLFKKSSNQVLKLKGKDFACNTCMIILLTCYQRVYDTTKI